MINITIGKRRQLQSHGLARVGLTNAMSETLKGAIQAALLRMLQPLVKWLLEAGIGVGDLQSLVKIAYVRAARDQGQRSGVESRRPNVSRIAVVTGLTRAEVTRILTEEGADRPHDRRRRQRAERVLSGWWNDAAFQDDQGHPAELPLRGKRRSFAALVERYSGERWLVPTILDELLRVKAVRRLTNGRLQATSRTTATVRWSAEGLAAFGEQLNEHCETLLHNFKNPSQPRYVRRLVNARLDPSFVPLLRRDIEEQAEGLAESIDHALNDPSRTPTRESSGGTTTLGVAVYVFEGSPDELSDEAPHDATKRQRRRSLRSRRLK
jgi:hypothetical protein